MIVTPDIDGLILNEKKAIQWYLCWFVSIVLIGVSLIIVNLATGWIKEVGPSVGSAFVLLLAKPPLTELLRRRDRVTALKTLRAFMAQVAPDSDDAKGIEDMFGKMLLNMLGG